MDAAACGIHPRTVLRSLGRHAAAPPAGAGVSPQNSARRQRTRRDTAVDPDPVRAR